MKQVLLVALLFIGVSAKAQNVLLKADTNSIWIDKDQLPLNKLRIQWRDSSMAIIGVENNNIYSGAKPYYRYTNAATGNAFSTYDSLKAWVRDNFFVDAPSGGSGGGDTATLESVTTGTGNNITPNALQVKDALNLNVDSQTTVVYNYGAAINGGGLAVTTNGSLRRIAEYSEDAGTTVIYNDPQSQSILLREQTGSNAGIVASGRIQGQAGINATDYAVMSQLLSLGETSTTAYRGDRGKTAYDHSQIVDGTNPHNTTFANIASKPTTISGYGITDAAILGGNTLGAEPVIGSTDNFALSFKVNNSVVAKVVSSGIISSGGVQNLASAGSARVLTQSTGVLIDRNVNDANSLAKFNYINTSGTGLTIDCQKNGTTNASISNTGVITGSQFRVSALNATPASATDTGTTGEIRITSGFIYVCIATNTWVRVAMATW